MPAFRLVTCWYGYSRLVSLSPMEMTWDGTYQDAEGTPRVFWRATRCTVCLIFDGTSARRVRGSACGEPRVDGKEHSARGAPALPLSVLTDWQGLFEHTYLAVGAGRADSRRRHGGKGVTS